MWGGLRALESGIRDNARTMFKNKTLRVKDLLEWTTGRPCKAEEGEIVAEVSPAIWVCIKKELDKRTPEESEAHTKKLNETWGA